jgi:hypothetical protein
MTNLAMSVFIDDLVGLALRIFGTTEGSVITRLFTILKKKTKSKTHVSNIVKIMIKTVIARYNCMSGLKNGRSLQFAYGVSV